MNFLFVDWLIMAIYAVVILTVGLYIVKKPKTSEGYFLANRQLRWPFIGASLLASNISAEHFVGLAGGGYAIGLAIGAGYEWSAIFCLMPLIFLFLPFYLKNKIFTVPEFLERRFSPGIRLLLSGVMLVLSVLTKISISLWASAVVFHTLFGWDYWMIIWGVGIITALYTMKGGLTTVVYTDAIQTVVLLVAAFILTVLGLQHVGGIDALCAKVPPELLKSWRPATDLEVPWTGVVFGIFLGASFYWSMDQVLVQRVFAARDLNEGRKGAIFAGALKLLIPFVLVVPGIIARAMFPNLGKADEAYPMLLKAIMPHGLLGLTVAGITAALMGHLSATYNSVSTLFTRDFYLKLRPNATSNQQILVGRITVIVVAVLGAFWAPYIGGFPSLWNYLQNVFFYMVMPFVAVFFLGVIFKRINTTGVWVSVLTGFAVGATIMIDRFSTHFLPFMQNKYMKPWLHGAVLEFLICVVVLVGVSLATAPPPAEKTDNTTLSRGALPVDPDAKPTSLIHDYRLWVTIVGGCSAALYIIFR